MSDKNNVQLNANSVQNMYVAKNKVAAKARKKAAKDENLFQKDGAITKSETKLLKKEFGISKKELEEWKAFAGGEEFLDTLLHAADSETDEAKILAARKEIVKEYFLNSRKCDLSPELMKQLEKFGFTSGEVNQIVESNLMDEKAPRKKITPKAGTGENEVTVRMEFVPSRSDPDKIAAVRLYDKDAVYDDINTPNKTLAAVDEAPGFFADNDSNPVKYYKLNGDVGLVEVDAPAETEEPASAGSEETDAAEEEQTVREEPASAGSEETDTAEEEQTVREEPSMPSFSEVFKKNKTVTVNEKGSRQRLTAKEEWNTSLKVPKGTGYTEDGIPKRLAIQLPSSYGSIGPDGKKQVRYQTLKLIDPENMIYSDSAGVRKFKMEITEDGIKLSLVGTSDSKIKEFLDENTKVIAEQTEKEALTDNKEKLEIKSKDESDSLMAKLSNRNSAWQTYLKAGTDNGYLTGTYGLLEKLVDESDITQIKTYNDLKPAIDGLLARIPENLRNTPEYKAIEKAVNKLAAEPDAEIKSRWYNNIIGTSAVRELDLALVNFAKKHMVGQFQGTNQANNSFWVSPNGKVTIQPDRTDSMWKSDAKFTIGGKDYYLYQERPVMDRTVDYQDFIVDGGKYYDLPGVDQGVKYYFKTKGGKKLYLIIEDGTQYVRSSDGTAKVSFEDILSGRADMPE